MSTQKEDGPGADPQSSIGAPWNIVGEALRTARLTMVERSQEVGLCAIKQAEENSARLFETLREMAAAPGPTDIYLIYSRYLTETSKQSGAQLREMSQVLADAGLPAWDTVSRALPEPTR